jgi:hypothetical protein
MFIGSATHLNIRRIQNTKESVMDSEEILNYKDTDIRLYAINGGNDLAGIVLTEAQCVKARKQLATKTDWPYFPRHGDEWLGQPH